MRKLWVHFWRNPQGVFIYSPDNRLCHYSAQLIPSANMPYWISYFWVLWRWTMLKVWRRLELINNKSVTLLFIWPPTEVVFNCCPRTLSTSQVGCCFLIALTLFKKWSKFMMQSASGLQVAELLVEVFAEMVFCHGFVHGDPHPGNILVRPREQSRGKRNFDLGVCQLLLLSINIPERGLLYWQWDLLLFTHRVYFQPFKKKKWKKESFSANVTFWISMIYSVILF